MFTDEQEADIVTELKAVSNHGSVLTKQVVEKKVVEYAANHGMDEIDVWLKGSGKSWYYRFVKKYNLSSIINNEQNGCTEDNKVIYYFLIFQTVCIVWIQF